MYYFSMEPKEPSTLKLKFKELIDQIPEKGLAPLITYGSPQMCVIKIGKSGIQRDSCLYFYPYNNLSKITKVSIASNLHKLLSENVIKVTDPINKKELIKLINIFVKGGKTLSNIETVTVYLNSSNTGELIVISNERIKIAFALVTNIKRSAKNKEFTVIKNLIPNSVVISV